jgi:DNA-binding protein H-NS
MEAFKSKSVDELWALWLEVSSELAHNIAKEKAKLEERLRLLEDSSGVISANGPYPTVLPKYQNPENPTEKWSGRGKQPRWLQTQLRAGKDLNSFLLPDNSGKGVVCRKRDIGRH